MWCSAPNHGAPRFAPENHRRRNTRKAFRGPPPAIATKLPPQVAAYPENHQCRIHRKPSLPVIHPRANADDIGFADANSLRAATQFRRATRVDAHARAAAAPAFVERRQTCAGPNRPRPHAKIPGATIDCASGEDEIPKNPRRTPRRVPAELLTCQSCTRRWRGRKNLSVFSKNSVMLPPLCVP